jgi:hypothetical protein
VAEAGRLHGFRQPPWGRASKIMAPTSCFTGQVHRLPDSPSAYGAMISRPMAAPAQSRSTDLDRHAPQNRSAPQSKLASLGL